MTTSESKAVVVWRQAMQRAGYPVCQHPGLFHCSQLLTPNADRQAAELAYRQLLDVAPDLKDALDGLAFLLQLQGRSYEARIFRRRTLALHVKDLGVVPEFQKAATDYLLAGEGGLLPPEKAPPAYVKSLFDQYARDFDEHLLDKLDYRTPDLIFDVVNAVFGDQATALDILDLGCGTGLAGRKLRSLANSLHGIDLSQEMLDKARAREVYDRLDQGDITEVTAQCGISYDLVIAADVLVYFGALLPLFSAVHAVLRDQAFFVFSVEKGSRDGFRLRSTGRYQHSFAYISDCAHEAGFEVSRDQEAVLRMQDDQPVAGYVFALQAA